METLEQAREHALAAMQQTNESALSILEDLVLQHNQDAVLQYLYAGALAQHAHYDQAITTFETCLNLAPYMHIARFQLCLLAATLQHEEIINRHLSCLLDLDKSHYLQAFSQSIQYIRQGNEAHAAEMLQQGIALNQENDSLNQDMRNLLTQLKSSPLTTDNDNNTSPSQTQSEITGSVLLDIYKQKRTLDIDN